MKKYDLTTVERIDRRKAAKMYNMGFDVQFIPCKLNPENDFYSLGIVENMFLCGQYGDFNKLLNAYEYFNCRPDTGNYTAFYVERAKMLVHFEFSDGSNPYIFRGSPVECYNELLRWAKNFDISPIDSGFYKLTEKHPARKEF